MKRNVQFTQACRSKEMFNLQGSEYYCGSLVQFAEHRLGGV